MSTRRRSHNPRIKFALLGQQVREKRYALGFDQHRVACLSNVNDTMVAIIEDGQADIDDMSDVVRVCWA